MSNDRLLYARAAKFTQKLGGLICLQAGQRGKRRRQQEAAFQVVHSPDRPAFKVSCSSIPSDAECLWLLENMRRTEERRARHGQALRNLPEPLTTVGNRAGGVEGTCGLRRKEGFFIPRDNTHQEEEWNDNHCDALVGQPTEHPAPLIRRKWPGDGEEPETRMTHSRLQERSWRRDGSRLANPSVPAWRPPPASGAIDSTRNLCGESPSDAGGYGDYSARSPGDGHGGNQACVMNQCALCKEDGILDGRRLCRVCAWQWDSERNRLRLKSFARPTPPSKDAPLHHPRRLRPGYPQNQARDEEARRRQAGPGHALRPPPPPTKTISKAAGGSSPRPAAQQLARHMRKSQGDVDGAGAVDEGVYFRVNQPHRHLQTSRTPGGQDGHCGRRGEAGQEQGRTGEGSRLGRPTLMSKFCTWQPPSVKVTLENKSEYGDLFWYRAGEESILDGRQDEKRSSGFYEPENNIISAYDESPTQHREYLAPLDLDT